MNTDTIKNALQDLVIRLKDAEERYIEISESTSIEALKVWCKRYAAERSEMHKLLEGHITAMGGDPEIRTSYLSELHRALLDNKISMSSDEFHTVVNEIEKGSKSLLEAYDSVINPLELHPNLKTNLIKQKATIQLEVNNLLNLRNEFESKSI